MNQMIDWAFAAKVAGRIAGEGPAVGRDVADAAVAELREGARRSTPLVSEFTGLVTDADTAPVLVVDRRRWVQANSEAFAKILDPIMTKMVERKGTPGPLSAAIGARVTGAELGLMLGFLSGKVLGQFDPFHDPAGRLLLVAPNVVSIERELEVDPHDFRLWVCLHEETHRVQFTANPWLREHLATQMTTLADSMEPGRMLDDVVRRVSEAVRDRGVSALDLLSTPEQREIIDRVTGVMSLLEGHADVVMDGVGPSVIPSVDHIRKRFTERRAGVGMLDRFLRRLMGLDAKMAQYRDGAGFVRHVVDKVGMDEFNAVWTSVETLPTKADISDPDAWITRVL